MKLACQYIKSINLLIYFFKYSKACLSLPCDLHNLPPVPCHIWLVTLLLLHAKENCVRNFVLRKNESFCDVKDLIGKMCVGGCCDCSALCAPLYLFRSKLLLPSFANWWIGRVFVLMFSLRTWRINKHNLINGSFVHRDYYRLNTWHY